MTAILEHSPGAVRPGNLADELVKSLYEKHAATLLAYCLPLTRGDRGWAEDVVQETLFRAWRGAHRLDLGRPTLLPWLFTAARRLVVDGLRSRRVRPQEVDPTLLEHAPADDPTDRTIATLTVLEALRELTPPHREIIVEVYYLGRPVTETARHLRIRPGTAKSRLYYALRALRSALEERGYAYLD
jgi:RNA polymerase sigma-70 factor (ECF subfamily)